ncbi:MAG: sugar nucleotide-binding protein [Trueperaceae bacterium]
MDTSASDHATAAPKRNPVLLVTGSGGRLGREITSDGRAARRLRDAWTVVPARTGDGDVRDAEAVRALVARHRPAAILHAAAYTDVAGAERERLEAWSTNVAGTRHVAHAANDVGAVLIHVSSDYVFWGGDDRPGGGYRESDPPGPVRNYYALTKLAAEEAARSAERRLIVRTSFRESVWPHPAAFTDLFTSQDYVDVIAFQLTQLLANLSDALARLDATYGASSRVLHLATERKSVFDLARRRNPEVQPGLRADVSVPLPEDISLNVERWTALRAKITNTAREDT